MNNNIDDVRAVLNKFQEGYTKRDVGLLDSFMNELFIKDEGQLIIGTGSDEWCRGFEQSRELVESDWKYWGDVLIDVDGASIIVEGSAAFLATSGTVSMIIESETCRGNQIESIKETIERDMTPTEKLLEIVRGATNTLYEIERGDHYIWPFRFMAVLVKRDTRWLFHQMQFSFPTTRFPDEREK